MLVDASLSRPFGGVGVEDSTMRMGAPRDAAYPPVPLVVDEAEEATLGRSKMGSRPMLGVEEKVC